MWEYKVVEIDYVNINELNNDLNIEGSNNWEVILIKEEINKNICNCKKATILMKRNKLNNK